MKARKIKPDEQFRCADCGFEGLAFPPEGGGSNYLVRRNRQKICKDCAEKEDRVKIAAGADRIFGYLECGSLRPRQECGIERGPGTAFQGVHGRTLGHVCRVGKVVPRTRYGPYGTRNYVRVVMFDGSLWHGTGANGMWCSLRRSKA